MTALRVCVVCAGNICRSPMAEAVFRSRLADAGLDPHVTVESAGTGGWHVGDPADPRAVRTLRAHGYDASGHRARRFEASWFDQFDLVLALDRANFASLRRLAPDDHARRKIRMLRSFELVASGPGDNLDVPDPYYGDDDGFEDVLRLVERSADGFVDDVRRRLANDEHGTGGSSSAYR